MEGFTKLSNNLSSWAWYTDNDTLAVYIRLLLGAAWTDTECQNVSLKRGQIATTIPKIAEQGGLTIRQTRTVLDRLKSTGKMTVEQTNKFSIITLIEYDCNIEFDRQNDSPTTGKRQASDKPTLLYKENKNIRNQETAHADACGGVGLEKNIKNSSSGAYEASFERFWSSYPKKTAKQSALKAWLKLKPDEELVNVILYALERFRKTDQWLRDNGQYIPYPATWLNNRRWEDDLSSEANAGRYYSSEAGETGEFFAEKFFGRSERKDPKELSANAERFDQEVRTDGKYSTSTRGRKDWLKGFSD